MFRVFFAGLLVKKYLSFLWYFDKLTSSYERLGTFNAIVWAFNLTPRSTLIFAFFRKYGLILINLL